MRSKVSKALSADQPKLDTVDEAPKLTLLMCMLQLYKAIVRLH